VRYGSLLPSGRFRSANSSDPLMLDSLGESLFRSLGASPLQSGGDPSPPRRPSGFPTRSLIRLALRDL